MPRCEDCDDADATSLWDLGEDHAFWTGKRMQSVCEACWTKRDNYDPPDPDGEAFRGGEAAAYHAEQMDAARRLK
jgi:hypothetical protein